LINDGLYSLDNIHQLSVIKQLFQKMDNMFGTWILLLVGFDNFVTDDEQITNMFLEHPHVVQVVDARGGMMANNITWPTSCMRTMIKKVHLSKTLRNDQCEVVGPRNDTQGRSLLNNLEQSKVTVPQIEAFCVN